MNNFYTFLIVISLFFLAACGNNSNISRSENKITKPKTTIILLYDISLSNDGFAVLTESHLTKLFYAIAGKGGGKFYSILVKSNSIQQEIFEFEIPSLDTLELTGNMYQKENRREKNKNQKDQLAKVKSTFLTQCKSKLLLPKTEAFTDLKGALDLAKTMTTQPNIKSTNINLIIISDGMNDQPPITGTDKMKATEFKEVNTILVRPIIADFLIGNPTITNSINDCIYTLK